MTAMSTTGRFSRVHRPLVVSMTPLLSLNDLMEPRRLRFGPGVPRLDLATQLRTGVLPSGLSRARCSRESRPPRTLCGDRLRGERTGERSSRPFQGPPSGPGEFVDVRGGGVHDFEGVLPPGFRNSAYFSVLTALRDCASDDGWGLDCLVAVYVSFAGKDRNRPYFARELSPVPSVQCAL